MALPNLTDIQIAWIIQQVAEYIQTQRHTYRRNAAPLDAHQMAVMQQFFPARTLDSTRISVLAEERVGNPPFYRELLRMGFDPGSLPDFSLMAAITFVDTVVSHEAVTDRLLFHELVHVVQYEKLGLPEFAAKYVRGFLTGGSYDAIPLEMNAYQLDDRFSKAPMNLFSVAAEVQLWMDEGRF